MSHVSRSYPLANHPLFEQWAALSALSRDVVSALMKVTTEEGMEKLITDKVITPECAAFIMDTFPPDEARSGELRLEASRPSSTDRAATAMERVKRFAALLSNAALAPV